MDRYKHRYIDFEAYERVAEPHKREKASAWRTAIGLQDVDGLEVSDYLKKAAVRHIEGDITIDDVRERLKSYYTNKNAHDSVDATKEEADKVAANIAKLLKYHELLANKSLSTLKPIERKYFITNTAVVRVLPSRNG